MKHSFLGIILTFTLRKFVIILSIWIWKSYIYMWTTHDLFVSHRKWTLSLTSFVDVSSSIVLHARLTGTKYVHILHECVYIYFKKKSFNVCIFIKKELFLHVVFIHYYNPRKEFAMGKMILTCQQVLFFFLSAQLLQKLGRYLRHSVEMCILLGNFGSIIFLKISAPLNLKFWPYIKRTVTVFNCNSSSTTARNLLTLWGYLGHNVYT